MNKCCVKQPSKLKQLWKPEAKRLTETEEMTIEEAPGPAGPKVLRLLYFVGAGFICTVAINKWREFEKKSIQKQHQESQLSPNLLSHTSSIPNQIQRPPK